MIVQYRNSDYKTTSKVVKQPVPLDRRHLGLPPSLLSPRVAYSGSLLLPQPPVQPLEGLATLARRLNLLPLVSALLVSRRIRQTLRAVFSAEAAPSVSQASHNSRSNRNNLLASVLSVSRSRITLEGAYSVEELSEPTTRRSLLSVRSSSSGIVACGLVDCIAGTTATGTTGFGTTGAFGQTQTNPQQPAAGGLFGQTPQNTGSTGFGAFGNNIPHPSIFFY